jgi:hypothetical protein
MNKIEIRFHTLFDKATHGLTLYIYYNYYCYNTMDVIPYEVGLPIMFLNILILRSHKVTQLDLYFMARAKKTL